MALLFVVYIPTREYEKQLEERKLTNSSSTLLALNNASSNKSLPKLTNGQEVNFTIGPTATATSLHDKDDPDKCMEMELKIGLQLLKINDAVWQKTDSGKFYQVVFPCESQERCEGILEELTVNGIGRLKESSVSVVPCSVFCQDEESEGYDCNETSDSSKDNKKSEFIKSITSRLTVAQVVEGIRLGAMMTFDFFALLILAGLIAGFGLMDSSSVSIVASMLVSPLMGPIMAISFGAVIHDKGLLKLGIISELVGLLMCLTTGFIMGLLVSWWQDAWERGPWPTSEMFGRGQTRSLWVGMLVALPSGAGVAMSVVGGNISALVGVAISASLLPPSVNCGILWGNALILVLQSINDPFMTRQYNYNGEFVNITNRKALLPPEGYSWLYSSNMARESAALGSISFCLTLVNIASIILMACIVFKIKEVAPSVSMPRTSRFWREDIKTFRDYNRTIQGGDSRNLGQALESEWRKMNSTNTISELEEMIEKAEDDVVYRTIQHATEHQFSLPPRHSDRRGSRVTWLPSDFHDHKPTVFETFHGMTSFRGSHRRSSAPRNRKQNHGNDSTKKLDRFHVTKADEDLPRRPLSLVLENEQPPV